MKPRGKSYLLAVVLGVIFSCWAGLALAKLDTKVSALVPQAQLVGEARMKYLVWKVYDAKLYSSYGEWRVDQPFALELTYLRNFSGEAIAKRSIEEMREQGFTDEVTLSKWHQQLSEIIPDVSKGTRVTGVVDANRHTLFFSEGENIATVADPLFSEWFFSIWLGEDTSEPKMRRQLLGAE